VTDDVAEADVSGVRQRTRRAIIDAAIAVWARDFSAPLGDIADRAGVSRSTLHRYYPDRQALVDATLVESVALMEREAAKALSGCANAAEELESLLRAMVDYGDVLIFLFADPNRFTDNSHWNEADDEELPGIIARAQADGAVAADLDPAWVVGIFYSICYVAAESIAADRLPRHRAAEVAVRTFFHGVV
jgi:AcrR family transcriptional regulator